MSEQVSISIKLCNRTYRIKVAAENEAKVRQIMQQIGDKIADLKKNFPGRDDHDYMAMTLIDHALHGYLREHEAAIGKPLVALMAMSVRASGSSGI